MAPTSAVKRELTCVIPLFITSPPTEKDWRDLLESTWHEDGTEIFSLVTGPQRTSQITLSTPSTLSHALTADLSLTMHKSALEILSLYRAAFDGPCSHPIFDLAPFGVFFIFDARSSLEETLLLVEDEWDGPGASEYRAGLAAYCGEKAREDGYYFESPTDEDYRAIDRLIVNGENIGEKTMLIARGARARRVRFENAFVVAGHGLSGDEIYQGEEDEAP